MLLGRLVAVIVLLIIVVSLSVWVSRYMLGDKYAGLFWGAVLTLVVLRLGIFLATMPAGMAPVAQFCQMAMA